MAASTELSALIAKTVEEQTFSLDGVKAISAIRDRAVVALLDDFETLLKISKVFPSGMLQAEADSIGASNFVRFRDRP